MGIKHFVHYVVKNIKIKMIMFVMNVEKEFFLKNVKNVEAKKHMINMYGVYHV